MRRGCITLFEAPGIATEDIIGQRLPHSCRESPFPPGSSDDDHSRSGGGSCPADGGVDPMPQIRSLGEFRRPPDEACEGCAETPGLDALAGAGLGISKPVAVVDMPAKGEDAVAAADFEAALVGR